MDKPSDRVLKPMTFPEDEKAIRKDWEREHPQEAEMMRQWPEGQTDAQLGARMFERAHQAKAELMSSEGDPAEYGRMAELPQSSQGKERERETAALRNAASGAAEELDPARAVDSKPFKL